VALELESTQRNSTCVSERGLGNCAHVRNVSLAWWSMIIVVQAMSCHALFLCWFCMRVPILLRVFATAFVSFLGASPSL